MGGTTDTEDEEPTHLEEVPDGAGCTGIWEYLSERREDPAPSESTDGEEGT